MARIKKEFKNKFTTVSNDFLYDQEMGLSERGLLITMLAMPDTWDFNAKGLASIVPNGVKAVNNTLQKLEELGYLKRERIRENGTFIDWEYTFSDAPLFKKEGKQLALERKTRATLNKKIKEGKLDHLIQPQDESKYLPEVENAVVLKGQVESNSPQAENPVVPKGVMLEGEIPKGVAPKGLDNIRTKEVSTYQVNTYPSIHPNNHSQIGKMKDTKRVMEEDGTPNYLLLLKQNLDYQQLLHDWKYQDKEIDNLIHLMVEVLENPQGILNINQVPISRVKVGEVFLKLKSDHIDYVLRSLSENPQKISNLKNYLLATLYNSYFTKDLYWNTKVNYDISQPGFYKE